MDLDCYHLHFSLYDGNILYESLILELLPYPQQQPQRTKKLVRRRSYLLTFLNLTMFIPSRLKHDLKQALAQFENLCLQRLPLLIAHIHNSPLNALSRTDGNSALSSADVSACMRLSTSTLVCKS